MTKMNGIYWFEFSLYRRRFQYFYAKNMLVNNIIILFLLYLYTLANKIFSERNSQKTNIVYMMLYDGFHLLFSRICAIGARLHVVIYTLLLHSK